MGDFDEHEGHDPKLEEEAASKSSKSKESDAPKQESPKPAPHVGHKGSEGKD